MLAYSVDADTIAAVPTEIDEPGRRRRAGLRRARRLHAPSAARRSRRASARRASFAYVARQGHAGGSQARARAGAARDHAAQGEPPLLPEQRARGARRRLRRARQRRPRRDRVRLRLADSRQGRQGPDPDRREAARDLQPRRAAGDRGGRRRARRSISTCSTSPSASCASASKRTTPPPGPRSSWTRGPARSWRSRTGRPSTPTPSGRRTTTRGGTARSRASTSRDRRSRSSTASAALEQQVITPETMVETSPGHITFPGRKPIYDTHHYGTIDFTDVIVKSSNVGAIKVGLKLGPQRLGDYITRFGFGQTLGPDFRGETAGIVWDPARLNDSALASISMGYQVGVTPLQMVTAVSAVANGGHRLAAARRPRLHQGRPPHRGAAQGSAADDHRRHGGDHDDDHGAGRRAGHGARRADSRLHDRRQDRHRREAGQRALPEVRLQRVVRRVHSVAQAGARHPRRHRLAAREGLHRRRRVGADLPAHRGSVADLSRHRAEPQRAAAGARRAPRSVARLGRRRRSRRARPACCRRPSSRRATA